MYTDCTKSYDAAGLELASIPPQQHNSLYHLYDSLLKFTGDLELSSIVRELKEDFAQITISKLPALIVYGIGFCKRSLLR